MTHCSRLLRDKTGSSTALVYDGDSTSIRNLATGHLVALGLARVDKKSAGKAVTSEALAAFEALKEEEGIAHADKVGIWRYVTLPLTYQPVVGIVLMCQPGTATVGTVTMTTDGPWSARGARRSRAFCWRGAQVWLFGI